MMRAETLFIYFHVQKKERKRRTQWHSTQWSAISTASDNKWSCQWVHNRFSNPVLDSTALRSLQVWKIGVKNTDMFRFETRSRFGELDGTSSPRTYGDYLRRVGYRGHAGGTHALKIKMDTVVALDGISSFILLLQFHTVTIFGSLSQNVPL